MEHRKNQIFPSESFPAVRFRERRGMALIFALVAIVLLTVTILAFFTKAQLNRQLFYTRSNEARAELLSHAAFDILLGELREEIRNDSTSLNGGGSSYPPVYWPNTTADVGLKSLGTDGTGPITIANVSTSGVGLYPSEGTASAGRALGSNVSVSATSLNGRHLTSTGWFVEGPNLGSQTTLPTWVFVGRGNGIEVPTITTSSDPNSANDPVGSNYVIGRFAYTIYDIGGLLNANVAGYPTSSGSGTPDTPFKGWQAYADLTQIPGVTPSSLVNWRNPNESGTLTAYDSYIWNPAATTGSVTASSAGFLSATVGDSAFLSRSDLINFSQQGLGISSTSLPYLTQFSRSLNAPCWGPVADASTLGGSNGTPTLPGGPNPYAYLDNATTTGVAGLGINNHLIPNVRFSSAGAVTHYSDNGSGTTYTVNPGDPLVQYRFSLAKLSWLTSQGPATGISATAIRTCFGLVWNSTTESWTYQPPEATSSPTTINNLFTVGSLTGAKLREPNFFELLKAGVLSGSIGGVSANQTLDTSASGLSSKQMDEANGDLQILKIGANIIDCAKADNLPSTLYLGTLPVHGAEDLPYLYGVINSAFYSVSANSTSTTTPAATMYACSLFLVPLLFNPNDAPSTSTLTQPAQFQVTISSGTLNSTYLSVWSGLTNANSMYETPGTNLSQSTSPIIFPPTSPDVYRTGVLPVYNATGTTTLLSTLAMIVSNTNINGFLLYTYPQNQPYMGVFNGPSGAGNLRAVVQNLCINLQYKSPYTGNWHTYDTLIGNDADPTSGMGGGGPTTSMDFYPGAPFITRQTLAGPTSVLLKIDPRTSRYGIGFGETIPTINGISGHTPTISGTSNYNLLTSWSGLTARLPFGSGSSSGLFPPLWDQGGTSDATGTSNNVADPDGIVRTADGWISSSGTTTGPANLFGSITSTSNSSPRPQLLHRPFQNVAELGYVFRDTPWKTLNFFGPNSGDGALLDLFSVADEPTLVDDRVNLNSQQPLIMQSLLSGAGQNSDGTSTLTQPGTIATAFNSYAYSTPYVPTSSLALSAAQLPDFLNSLGTSDGLASIKGQREAVVRAMAGATQTRTWNVLIDVVAQVGRYPASAKTTNDFIVEGEKRYWLSAAIDRYTGKVIDQQMEPVNQ